MADPADIEIVRLPVPDDGLATLRALCEQDPYFTQDGVLARRVLSDTAESAVLLILEWETRSHADRAIRSEVGRAFLDRLLPLLVGMPEIGHYAPFGAHRGGDR